MQSECYKASAVVLAKGHNPTILHPAFLKHEGIIPQDWEPSKDPVCTPPFAAASFTSGFSFVVEQERLVISFSGEEADSRVRDVAEMARKYTAKLPHVAYTAVGINFDVFSPFKEPANFIIQRFIKQGPWNNQELPLATAKQNFTYNYSDYQLNITIESGSRGGHDQSMQDGVLLHANYHGRCSEDSVLDSMHRLLQQAEKRKEHFKYITKIILGDD